MSAGLAELPPLRGSAKQIDWAERIRAAVLDRLDAAVDIERARAEREIGSIRRSLGAVGELGRAEAEQEIRDELDTIGAVEARASWLREADAASWWIERAAVVLRFAGSPGPQAQRDALELTQRLVSGAARDFGRVELYNPVDEERRTNRHHPWRASA